MTTRIVLVTACLVAMATLVAPQCRHQFPEPINEKKLDFVPLLKPGETIGLILGIGCFAFLIAILYIVIRKYIYHDTHLLDTFFDAGGGNNFAVVACAVVSRWLWAAFYAPVADAVYLVGIVGHFWAAATTTVQLLLFSMVVSEFRTKMPGAKTFLQVIYCRFGSVTHIVIMIFAMLINLFIMGLVMAEGTKVFSAITTDLSSEVIAVLLTLAVSVFTVFGGVGGGLYVAYFACSAVVAIMLLFFFTAFYKTDDRPSHGWGFNYDDRQAFDTACDILQCGRPSNVTGNLDESLITFSSPMGIFPAFVGLLTGFSYVFVNQAFWTGAATARPRHAVWGFLTAGITFFAIPFTFSLMFGTGHWVASVLGAELPVLDPDVIHGGYIPILVSRLTLGRTGDFLMATLTVVVVMMSVSAQINSLSAIFMYDIYHTYIIPLYSLSPPPGTTSTVIYADPEMYNRRSLFFRHAITFFFCILAFPAAVGFLAIPIGFWYLFLVVAIVGSCAVLPVCMSVSWHRTTRVGVLSGVAIGLVAGITVWLVMAGSQPGGLDKFIPNTSNPMVVIAGLLVSLGVGGIICLIVSLCSGGLADGRNELDVWDRCQAMDNPARPWALQYALDSPVAYTGIPHYEKVRAQYRAAEVSAYVIGTLLTVIILLVWPALMLVAGVWNCSAFAIWIMVAIVLSVVSALFLGVLTPFAEIIQLCLIPSLSRRQPQEVSKVELPVCRQLHVIHHEPTPPHYAVHATSHALADDLTCPKVDPVDDDDDSVVNADGLNVLSDPLAPPPRGGRRPPPSTAQLATNASQPIVYPLSSSMNLQPCYTCGPELQPYCISATDIPTNGVGAITTPTTQFSSTGGASNNMNVRVHLD